MPLLGKRLNWKQQSKYATLINGALHEKLTAVRFRDCLRDGKADSAASGFARAGRIGAIKALKDIGQMLRRDAAAGVLYAQKRTLA